VAQFYDFAPFDIVSSFTLLFTFVPELRQHARYHAMALQKLQGMHNCALGFWEMLQLLREHPHYLLISRWMLMLSKLKQNYQSQQKKSFKELEYILQGKLITARLTCSF
jgi:hypothetical protein